MSYFVIWPNGQRFGPADIVTLRQWLHESRIDAQTVLEDAKTGQRMTAAHVLGLGVPPIGAPQTGPPGVTATSTVGQDPLFNPTASPYYRPSPYGSGAADPNRREGRTELNASWILGSLGLLTLCCSNVLLPLVGLGLGISAKSKGHPSAVAAIVFNAVVLAAHVGILLLGGLFSAFD